MRMFQLLKRPEMNLSARVFTCRADAEVHCVFTESCILPCPFPPGTEAVVHWILVTAGNPPVHSFYHNRDQLARQDQRYRGRTSLFKHQISRGNASLQLTGAKLQDQGRYKCYTNSTVNNDFKNIFPKVNHLFFAAPVGKVDLQQVGNRITCSSEGIFPKPELTWSTSPPSTVNVPNKPTVQKTEQLLYNISSSLTVSDSDSDLSYSCSISSGGNKRRATLFKTSKNSLWDFIHHDKDAPSSRSVILIIENVQNFLFESGAGAAAKYYVIPFLFFFYFSFHQYFTH
uniref:Ig-like domain-containing protein n=1 Tax=Seriola dumerili TaxID=41447 RepID=A0A3B4TAW7_SERDU